MADDPSTTRKKRKGERTFGWWFAASTVIAFLKTQGRYEWRGMERIPREGAFILTPNHVTHLDVTVMGWLLFRAGRVPRFLAKSSLFRVPGLGLVLKLMKQIPVERKKGAGGPSLEKAAALIKEGLGVIVYPEGTLTRDPDLWPMRGRIGAARLALEHGIEVIPVAHWGVQEILPRYGKRLAGPPRKKVVSLVGEPVDLSRWAGRDDPEALHEAAEEIMRAITTLLAELRGEEPPETRWDPSEHGQAETGKFEGEAGQP